MVWQYVIGAGLSLFGAWNRHKQKKKEVEARNRARLNQFYDASNSYVASNILKDTSWKDEVIQQEVKADEAFQTAAETWRSQDLQLEQSEATHAFNVVDALTQRYKAEYAGEQTGVTASRLAAEPIRQAGYAITKSVRNVIMAQDTVDLNKEIATNTANRARWTYYEAIRTAPIRAHSPNVPDLEAEPSSSEMWTDFAIGAATSAAGTWASSLQKGENMFQFAQGLKGGLNQVSRGGGGYIPAVSQDYSGSFTGGSGGTNQWGYTGQQMAQMSMSAAAQGINPYGIGYEIGKQSQKMSDLTNQGQGYNYLGQSEQFSNLVNASFGSNRDKLLNSFSLGGSNN